MDYKEYMAERILKLYENKNRKPIKENVELRKTLIKVMKRKNG